MPSFVWNRHPEEAYANPYEHKAQAQFIREAKRVLKQLSNELAKYNLHFAVNDGSVQKAAWMLHNDAVDALQEALVLLEKKKHNLVGRIFRDVWESSQLIEYFLSGTAQSQNDLNKWFDNEIIEHRKIRERLEKSGKKVEAEEKRLQQRELSKFTHRSYRALLKGYSLGRDDRMVYDSYEKYTYAPQTLSAYLAVLGDLILQTLHSVKRSKLISEAKVIAILKQSMEKIAVPRRFADSRL